jgi:hypothetical protein
MTLLSAFVTSAIGPLFDNAVLEYLGDQKEHYGKQRLWVFPLLKTLLYYIILFQTLLLHKFVLRVGRASVSASLIRVGAKGW